MKWKLLIILSMLIFIPLVSAVDLLNGTILNTTISNSSMSFEGCEINVTQAIISPVSIELTNPFYINSVQPFSLPSFINYTAENAHIDCVELGPTFGTSTDQAVLFCDGIRDAFGDISLTNYIGIYGILGVWIVLSVITILIFIISNRDALANGDFVVDNLKLVGLAILGMGVIALLIIITLFTVEITCIV